jgi:hypothetical protein
MHAVSFVVQRELHSDAEIAGEELPLELVVVELVVVVVLSELEEQAPPRR